MEFKQEEHRFYLEDENHELLAELTFPIQGEYLCINHTYVSDRLRGQGIASQLMEAAVHEIHQRHACFRATCTYAIHWLNMHPEEQEGWIR